MAHPKTISHKGRCYRLVKKRAKKSACKSGSAPKRRKKSAHRRKGGSVTMSLAAYKALKTKAACGAKKGRKKGGKKGGHKKGGKKGGRTMSAAHKRKMKLGRLAYTSRAAQARVEAAMARGDYAAAIAAQQASAKSSAGRRAAMGLKEEDYLYA